MKTIYLFFFAMVICNTAQASPEKPLSTIIKGNSVCIYTNDKNSQPYEGQIYLYMGDVYPDKKYKSSYSKLYKNIKTPINQSDCISVDSSQFKSNIPYYISLDMMKSYATRICVDKTVKPFIIKKVINGFECESQVSKKQEKGFFQRLLDW